MCSCVLPKPGAIQDNVDTTVCPGGQSLAYPVFNNPQRVSTSHEDTGHKPTL